MTAEQKERPLLSTTRGYVPPAVFGPWALLMMFFAIGYGSYSWQQSLLFIVTGMLSWTLIEYFLHRLPFHHPSDKAPWKYLTTGHHMLHHEFPNRADYVVAPIKMSVIIFSVFLVLTAIFTQSLVITGLWGSGVIIGYLIYEWLHYSAHHRVPKTRLGDYLKKYHLIHHFKDSHNYFGVSSPFWDILFGTKPDYEAERDTTILPITSRERI